MKFNFAIYDRLRTGKLIFLILSAITIIVILLISNNLVKELARQERERMNIWAKATERLAQAEVDADYEFLLSIIQQNNSIPVLVADSDFNIIEHRNFSLPDKSDTPGGSIADLTERNRTYLVKRLKAPGGDTPLEEMAAKNDHFIRVEIYANTYQYIYYEDSILLKRLSLYPYVQLGVMFVMVLIIYFAVVYSKRAEQNRVWAGLSKETAHQLGTPISSLMAWSEYLQSTGLDPAIVAEINKDVKRLSVIADRFSKIGSVPELQLEYLNETLRDSIEYMNKRVSDRVSITLHLDDDNDTGVMLSKPLFEWVMENLTKNAVDAMGGTGRIDIYTGRDKNGNIFIDVKD
ncbi:MAG: ATP-binding protein, partial [Muribaculaceae bacterium]|nr:ATP-binding protein [Muribaculaceae bacterium]